MAKRDAFSGRLGFILATSGAAVGLGNIWKFPFEVANGGGAIFLFIYLLICFTICWPIMLSEASIGQAARKDAVSAYEVIGKRRWNFIGKIGVFMSILVLSFYNVVAGWAFGYFIEMLVGNFAVGEQFSELVNNIFIVNVYSLCFMLITAFIVSKGISGGIEKASRIMMPLLLIIILFLGIYAMTLPHAGKGIAFYLFPDFSELKMSVIYSAAGQAFFSLSLGMSAVITYGSYLPKNHNMIQSTAFITLADVGVAFLAGFMVFPFVSFLSAGDMESIKAGPALIFETLPTVFASLGGVWGVVIGSLFFLLICFAALTSTISLLEVPVSYAVDKLKVGRVNSTFFLAMFIFLLGIPSAISFGDSSYYSKFISYTDSTEVHSFFSFVTHITDTGMTFGGFLIAVFVAYVWKNRNLSAQIATGNLHFRGSFLERYIHFALSYLCPLLIGAIFIVRVLQQFFGLFEGV